MSPILRILCLFQPFIIALLIIPGTAFADDWESATRSFSAGRFDEAVEAFTAFVEAHPETPQGHFMLGLGLMQLKRETEARASLARAAELAGEEPRYRLALARADLKAGTASDALNTLKPLDPGGLGEETATYVSLLVSAAREVGDPASARQLLRRATGALPGERFLWLALAEAEQELGSLEDAFDAFEAAHRLDPADVDLAHRTMKAAFDAASAAEGQAGRIWYERAFTVASRLAESKPSALAWRLGGKALMGAQRYDEAGTWFARSAALTPSADLSYHQGRCLLQGDEPAERATAALALLDAALEQKPEAELLVAIHEARGLAFHYLEDFIRAAEAYRLAGDHDKVAEMGRLAEIKKGNEEWERFRAECERKHREAQIFLAKNEELRGEEGWQLIEDEIALQLSGCEEVLGSIAAR